MLRTLLCAVMNSTVYCFAKAKLSTETERFALVAEDDWNLDSKILIWQSVPIF